ncbi:MAG: hypothetical protein ABJB01_02705 [Rudaea sp.]
MLRLACPNTIEPVVSVILLQFKCVRSIVSPLAALVIAFLKLLAPSSLQSPTTLFVACGVSIARCCAISEFQSAADAEATHNVANAAASGRNAEADTRFVVMIVFLRSRIAAR